MKTLIVGIEETAESRDALRLAAAFAANEEVQLHVVAVLSYESINLPADEYEAVHEAHFDLVFSMAWEELGEGFSEHRISHISPAAELNRVAEEIEADGIIIGSCHRGVIGRLAIGDVGAKLTSGAPCPLMVAPRGYAQRARNAKFERIGVGYDGTAESKVALEVAAQLARQYGGALSLIGVIPPLSIRSARISGTDRGFDRLLREEMTRRLDAAAEFEDLECSIDLRIGDRADELATASEDMDLLVIGSRGYGPLGRVFLGGTSPKVMRSAACPVLVVPRGAETAGEGDPREVVATLAPF